MQDDNHKHNLQGQLFTMQKDATASSAEGSAGEGTHSYHHDEVESKAMSVLVPYPVDKAYDYIVPKHMDVGIGDFVCVPFNGREIPAVIWGESTGEVTSKKLKHVISRYNIKPMNEVMKKFIDWVASYTMTPKGAILKMSMSAPAGLDPPKAIKAYKVHPDITDKIQYGLSPKRQSVINVLKDGYPRRPAEIAELAGCSSAVIKAMAEKELLKTVELYNPAPCKTPNIDSKGPVLSESQNNAAQILTEQVKSNRYHATLLDGVTGAGKTEVYFEAIIEALRSDKQVLLLLPEIALSNAFLDRFQKRFGCTPALWHSHLTPAQRRNSWRGVAQGDTKVVVGARSALFLPYQNLGLILVDEEHDPAYKQEEGAIYNARDMAVLRAHMGNIPIALISATPSLETMHNAWAEPVGTGRYTHITLPDRFGGAQLPDIHLIDMREAKLDRQHFLSQELKNALAKAMDEGGQALLFLNRRGYAPLTLCQNCGHRFECPRCTAWLVEHKSHNRLECHHCGFVARPPKVCPECHAEDSLVACGPGVERIYEESKAAFPNARIVMLTSDTAGDNETLKTMLADIRDHQYDIIIGTQIIAKGHHFPHLTCVGVVDADLGLDGGELRAAERTYQLLHQVAGRAGREQHKGHVYLQSYRPDHRIMKALAKGERDPFLEIEAFEREQAHMPPFSRLVGIVVAGRDESQVDEIAKQLGKTSPQGVSETGSVQTLGPAPAPYAKLRGRHRRRLLVRADKNIHIQKTIHDWVSAIQCPSTVRVYIDIDPYSFM